jgi:sugar-phosphatase
MSNSLGRYQAFLFDMDGTLIDSTAAAERVWGKWARRHGLDVATFLPKMHGRRSADTVRDTGITGLDIEAESRAVTDAEIVDTAGVVAIAGAAAFVDALPPARWAIVTSAPLALAKARLKAAGLDLPAVIITAEDVQAGKPDPMGYRLAADRLSVAVGDCLVFEDADAGIRAGEAAGCDVLIIGHSGHGAMAHPSADDYTGLSVRLADEALELLSV